MDWMPISGIPLHCQDCGLQAYSIQAQHAALNSEDTVWARSRGLRAVKTASLAPGRKCRDWRARGRGGSGGIRFFRAHLTPEEPAQNGRDPVVRPGPASRPDSGSITQREIHPPSSKQIARFRRLWGGARTSQCVDHFRFAIYMK